MVEMRHPRTFKVLAWAGPTFVVFCGGCVGLIAALAQPFPGVRTWAQDQFHHWWPIVTSLGFLLSAAVVIAAYLVALVYTGTERRIAPPPVSAFAIDDHTSGAPNKVERDTSADEALGYIAFREWGRDFSEAWVALMERRIDVSPCNEFRQKALDSEITVWGVLRTNAVYDKIPATHWAKHGIDEMMFLAGNYSTKWTDIHQSDDELYSQLMVNKAEIEGAWGRE